MSCSLSRRWKLVSTPNLPVRAFQLLNGQLVLQCARYKATVQGVAENGGFNVTFQGYGGQEVVPRESVRSNPDEDGSYKGAELMLVWDSCAFYEDAPACPPPGPMHTNHTSCCRRCRTKDSQSR